MNEILKHANWTLAIEVCAYIFCQMSAATFLGKVFVKFLGKYLFEERMCVFRFFTKTKDKCQMSAHTFLAFSLSLSYFLTFTFSGRCVLRFLIKTDLPPK